VERDGGALIRLFPGNGETKGEKGDKGEKVDTTTETRTVG
jgi:hypothetical protein